MDTNAQHALMARQAAGMVVVMVSFVVNRLRRISEEETIPYGPRTEAEKHRQSTLQMMYNYNDVECIAMLRMKRVPFFSLCNLLRSRKLVLETVGCPVEEQVAMFIHVVGHNQRFRVVHQSFRRSIETVSRIFHQVLYVIGELRADMIKPPSTATHPKIMGSHRWFPFLKVLSCLYVSHTCSYQCVSTYVNLLVYGHLCRIALVPLMAHMCWQGCLDTCSKLSGVGNPPQLRM
jgi:hypothetical protein